MSSFRFIQHRNMKDVCFQVFTWTTHQLVKGRWWNVACGDPFPLVDETIKITDPGNWETKYDPSEFQKKRKINNDSNFRTET